MLSPGIFVILLFDQYKPSKHSFTQSTPPHATMLPDGNGPPNRIIHPLIRRILLKNSMTWSVIKRSRGWQGLRLFQTPIWSDIPGQIQIMEDPPFNPRPKTCSVARHHRYTSQRSCLQYVSTSKIQVWSRMESKWILNIQTCPKDSQSDLDLGNFEAWKNQSHEGMPVPWGYKCYHCLLMMPFGVCMYW